MESSLRCSYIVYINTFSYISKQISSFLIIEKNLGDCFFCIRKLIDRMKRRNIFRGTLLSLHSPFSFVDFVQVQVTLHYGTKSKSPGIIDCVSPTWKPPTPRPEVDSGKSSLAISLV